MPIAVPILGFIFPLTLEFFSWWTALALFAAVGVPILLLGMRSLNGLGNTRKWTAIVIRLIVVLLFVLILGGARWTREHKELDVIVLRDVSDSTALVHNYPDSNRITLNEAVDKYLEGVASTDAKLGNKPAQDRIGIISFQDSALIDAMPNPTLRLEARSIRKVGAGTDPAAAIQLGLATMRKDSMHRILLIWDGNKTHGDLEAAIAAAASQRVPIDVMPLVYNVENEVLVESFTAPTMKNEKEPFALNLVLKSTNPTPVTGTITVYRQENVIKSEEVTLAPAVNGEPSLNPFRIRVQGLEMGGVHQFRATFEAKTPGGATTQPGGGTVTANAKPQSGDTLSQNNSGTAFTFVKGRGQTLFVDGTRDNQGFHVIRALQAEGIEIDPKNVIPATAFPNTLIQLQNYDSIILANVSAGAGGLSDEQFKMINAYVQDMGGGLLCIGGEDTYGAGGWQGRKIEEILPVNMDIPAQRQIAKGALVLVFHSCEMPDGNSWGEQCGIAAINTLSERDEIGVISFDWQGKAGGGAQWDFPLKEKGDGTAVIAAIKKMAQGDMPDFDDTFDLALNGKNGVGGLIRSNARQKHLIVISDGDPSPPRAALIKAYQDAKITVSTISVYPHQGTVPPTMESIAKDLKGKAYGPIDKNPNQLPQIFIKEATLVRRSLIQESLPPNKPLSVYFNETGLDFMKGLSGSIDSTYGMVLTSKKNSPQIEVPMKAGPNQDPLLAYWQTGLGRVIVWTSDAHPKWSVQQVGSPTFSKFWAQMVRAVARPPMSTDFTVTTTQSGGKGKVVIEAINRDNAFLNFLNFGGKVLGPDGQPVDVKVVQTGPGTYEGEFDAKQPGNYVAALNYYGQKGEKGTLTSGVAVNTSPELRDLTSNEGELNQIAERTGGRVLKPFDIAGADLFTRLGIDRTSSPLPIWDILTLILLGMILLDVASRRIAWDLESIRRMLATARGAVESYTQTTRKVENAGTMDALRAARQQAGEDIKTKAEGRKTPGAADVQHDRSRKFEAGKGVEGDISQVVGGASDKPIPSAPKKPEPKGGPGATDTLGGLMAAKRRAQQQIKDKEEGKN